MCRSPANAGDAAPQICVFPSRLGWFAVDWRGGKLHALAFGHAGGADAAAVLLAALPFPPGDEVGWIDVQRNPDPASPEVWQLAKRLQAYADGGPDEFLDVPVALTEGSVFHRNVLQQCRRIRYGQTWTYGRLAARVGSPRAARAVGTALARNRIPLIVPCHRVIGSTGTLRGYSGCGGLGMKQRLLELETRDRG